MFLSIIIPIYNAEKYLGECLQSCLTQNIPQTEYEIICINDGSTDNSLNILEAYSSDNSNIIIINQENSGVSVARNKGINVAKGQYIWFVDSDDFIRLNCLNELKELTENNYDIINFGAYAFTEQLSEEEKVLYKANKLEANKTYWGYPSFHLYKLNIMLENHIQFVKEIKYGEDEVFYNDMLSFSDKILQLDIAYYFYRKNSDSAMNKLFIPENQIKRLESVITSMIILKNGIESGRYNKEFTAEFLQARYKLVQYCFKRLDVRTAHRYFKLMSKNNLFNFEKLNQLDLPSKRAIQTKYLKEHFKIWKRAFYKKNRSKLKEILPEQLTLIIKKILRIVD